MPLQFRKGTDAQRAAVTFSQAEPVWTTDLHQLWIGDGTTPGGILITGGTGTSGGYISTSSISAAGNKLTINVDGSLSFPLGNTLYSTQTFNISAVGTVQQFNTNGVYIANTQTDSSHATVFINGSTASSVPSPGAPISLWALGKDGQNTRAILDNYGANTNIITGRSANGTPSAPTAETTGSVMLRVGGYGYGSTGFGNIHSANIDFVAAERLTDAARGGAVNIVTVNSGTLVANTSMSISSAGVTIQTPGNPAKGALFVNASGNTAAGSALSDAVINAVGKNNTKTRIVAETYSNTGTTDSIDNMSPIFTGRRARGSSSVPTAVKNGDTLSRYNGFGYDGTKFTNSASGYMSIRAAEDFTANANGGYIEFGVLKTGTTNTFINTVIDQGGITTESVNATVDIDAIGDITSQNNMFASNNVTAGKNLYAGDNAYINGTALVGGQATVGSLVSNSTIAASTNITAGNNITAAGDITGNDFTATGTIIAIGNITSGGTLQGTHLTLTSLANAATGYILSVNTSTGVVTYRDYTPFNISTVTNQALFTTSSVTFAQLTVTNASIPATGAGIFVNGTGGTSYPVPPNGTNALWAVTNDSNLTRILIDNFSSSPSSYFTGRGGRGTAATPSAVQSGDYLASFRGVGYGTTKFNTTSAAYMTMVADENFTDTANGSKIQFWANPLGVAGNANLITTFRPSGINIYSTGTVAGTVGSALTIAGPGDQGTYQGSQSTGTLVWGISKPNQEARITMDTYANPGAGGYAVDKSYFTGRRARGSSASPTALQAGDAIVRFSGYAYGTTGFLGTASGGMTVYTLENATDSAAGGQIAFDVQAIGGATTATQVIVATMDAANGLQVNSGGLTVNNGGAITATQAILDSAKFNDIYSKSVVPGTIGVHNPLVPSGTVNLGSSGSPWANIYGNTARLSTLNFTDSTSQTTAWTGSVSTSSVTGLATVAWTGKYSDLTGGPNQSLNTSSAVIFAGVTSTGNITANGNLSATGYTTLQGGATISAATVTNTVVVSGYTSLNGGATISAATVTNNLSVVANLTAGATIVQSLTVTTGTVATKTLTAGGFPLNSAGTASIFTSGGASPALVASNYSGGLVPNITLRGYGQNRPNGTSATAPNPAISIESAYGTQAAPTAFLASQSLGGVTAMGYDGANWPADYSQSYNFMGWFSTEAMTNSGTSTYQAGSGFNIYVQPQWTRPGINQSRQRFLFTNWTTSSTAPSQLNIVMGSGVDATTSSVVMVDGTTYVGPGKTNLSFVNAQTNFLAVPAQDSAPDNAGLTGTNIINLAAGRRNAVSGRRNQVLSGDTLYSINFRGQNTNNATSSGVTGAAIVATTLETFTTTQYGSNLALQTVNTGTTTLRNRLLLSDRLMQLSADQYQFNNGNFTSIPLSFTTSTWNSSIDQQTFQNNAGTVTMLQLGATTNTYNNNSHNFSDRTGSFPALTMTTSTAVFTAIPVMPTYTSAGKPASGSVGQIICISNSPTSGGRMAFWDTTNSRWSYISDNSAV